MKLLLLFLLLSCSAWPQAGTFSLKSGQSATCVEPSATSCSLPNNVTAGDFVAGNAAEDAEISYSGALYISDGNGIPCNLYMNTYATGNPVLTIYTFFCPWSPGGSKTYTQHNVYYGSLDTLTVYEWAPSAGTAIAVDGACVNVSSGSANPACTLTTGGTGDLAYELYFVEGNFSGTTTPWTEGACLYLCEGRIPSTSSTSETPNMTPPGQGGGVLQAIGWRLTSAAQVTNTAINIPVDKTSSLTSPVTIGDFRVSSQGSNICAVAGLKLKGTSLSLSGVTLGGTAMVSAGTPANNTASGTYSALYTLAAPPTGTSKALVLTYTGTLTEVIADVSTFQGCNQTTPVRSGSYTTAQGTLSGTTVSLPITSSTTDLTVSTGGGTLDICYTNQIWDGQDLGANFFFGFDHAVTPASRVTSTWTCKQSGDDYVLAGLSLQAAATGGQDPSPPTLSPSTASYTSAGGTGSVTVTCPSGCSWTATSSASWLTVTAGASGSGSGTVSYSVAANTSSASQSATLTIGGQTFTVTESGVACTFTLSASTASYTSAGGTGSVTVTCASGCIWTATSSASWLTVTKGASGNGSGTVNYSVAANTGSASQSGTLTVGGQTLTVTEGLLKVSSLAVSPTTTVGGVTVSGTVTLSGPTPTGGAVVTLTSSDLQAATTPSTLTVAAGASSASFSVTTYTQTSTETATLSASLNKTTQTVPLTVTPPVAAGDIIAASYIPPSGVTSIYFYKLSGTTITGTASTFTLSPFGVSYSPDGSLLYVSTTSGPTQVYSVSGGTPVGSPTTLPNPQPSVFGPVVSSDGQFIAVPVDSTGSIAGVQLIQKSGGSYIELPSATYGSYASLSASFDPLANHMAVALNGNGSTAAVTPRIFKRSGTTFSLLAGQPSVPFNDTYVWERTYVAFSPDGTYLYATDGGTDNSGNNMRIYAVSGDTFTWLSGQPNVQPSTPGPIAVSPNDVYIAVSDTYASPYITIYKRSGSTFTALPPPATLPLSQVQALTFTPDGNYLVVAVASSPYLLVYGIEASSDTFTPLPAPALLPPYPFNSLSTASVSSSQ